VGQLQQEVGFRKPGESVKVEVARTGGVRKTLNVKLQPLQEATQLAAGDVPDGESEVTEAGGLVRRRLGLAVQPAAGAVAQELQLPADARGLVVTDVTPGGPAWDFLFDEERGGPDVIVSVEGKAVKTEADLRNVLRSEPPGAVVTLRVYNPRQQGRRVERVRLAE
jgi:S1-C subfamily serine protease